LRKNPEYINKRIWALVWGFILIVVLVSGCSGDGIAGVDGESANQPAETADEESELLENNPDVGALHADLSYADYPGNCLECHADQANEMLNTTHYQWMGDAPDMVNGTGLAQGKLTNAVNSYCINILGNWPVCGTCHAGRGLRPDDAGATVENIDCLMCHNSDYASRRTRLADGSMGVAEPSDIWVQNIHKPVRANCLACHAKAGGGDGVKRGDLSLATATNTDRNFDVHMNAHGADLDCQACHVFENHKVIGKGCDIRPTDDIGRGAEVSCLTCHTGKGGPNGHRTKKLNDHVARVACQTCHIPTYAKVATETHRDWRIHHDGSPADDSAHPGHPYTEKMADLTPVYRFWNRTSDNALLGDDASRTYNGEKDRWPTSIPMGDVTDGKLYPFKYKTAMQPKIVADHRLIALNTYEYLKGSGNVATAIELGLTAMGYPAHEPYQWVLTDTHQLLNHGVDPSSGALRCGDCHGNSGRMDLQGELGYQLKGDRAAVCTQCHGHEDEEDDDEDDEDEGFQDIHQEHVGEKNIDCGRCHIFSRPERNLEGPEDDDDD
jgi:hypothetical protein